VVLKVEKTTASQNQGREKPAGPEDTFSLAAHGTRGNSDQIIHGAHQITHWRPIRSRDGGTSFAGQCTLIGQGRGIPQIRLDNVAAAPNAVLRLHASSSYSRRVYDHR